MKFIVLNGSPKGSVSVTMQYIHFLEKHFSDYLLSAKNFRAI
ncbi:MAG: hypothetical protein Q7J65_10255 [Candidatus Marinimicrobia bacterium]|nr:hypothetical protein [Candidatus Neomarinimicrobiota bacterium]